MAQSSGKADLDRLRVTLPDLRRPFVLAARNGFAELANIGAIDRRVKKLLEPFGEIAFPRNISDKLSRLFEAVKNFPDSSEGEKRKLVLKALAVIDSLQAAIEKSPDEPEAKASEDTDRRRLYMSVQYLKGVGPKVAQLMAAKNLVTVEDLLYYLPRRWEDLSRVGRITDLPVGEYGQAIGVIAAMSMRPGRYGKRPFELAVQDESASCFLTWFHFGKLSIEKRFKVGDRVRFGGKVSIFRGRRQIVHPEIEHEDNLEQVSPENAVRPVYPEIQGIPKKRLFDIMQNAVRSYTDLLEDPLPESLLSAAGLPVLKESIKALHSPEAGSDVRALDGRLTPHQSRLSFDELFFMQVALAISRRHVVSIMGRAHKRLNSLATKFYRNFPHKLTGAQRRVLGEIIEDLTSPAPMNRLLQGDVGSGKTIVAVLSALLVVENGRQVALMAPTEILAEQHYRTISGLCDFGGVTVKLLTGDIRQSEKRVIYDGIENGDIDFVIGTHALIQKGVVFRDLAYVIVDEQHRFGVEQRAMLRLKGQRPDCMVMTATPIPRSLTLTLYGDLDVSTIDELPKGRKPISTVILWMSEWSKMLEMLETELEAGRQAYVITPLISESEVLDLADAENVRERLSGDLPGRSFGLLHGRMPARDKDSIMHSFIDGAYDALVSTSVVEVGMDVPNATMMVVLHAERFGLSQLHQLRGRVGRGMHSSTCCLLCEKVGEDARERLSIMEETTDGFRISEKDLEIRGPGDFLGTRQVGSPMLQHANLLRDNSLLIQAREIAFRLIEEDPKLKKPENLGIRVELETRWLERLKLIGIG